jgi:iron-sulfur cluster assembly accessory protein|tara:strand:+ start:1675 stop:2001 length:327 start_codon:yes stop_codon:yes gene_type:complete
MISFTETAVEYIKDALDPGDLVRVAVVGGGCAGFSYDLSIVDEHCDTDVVVEQDGIKICLDPKSSFMLEETVVDYTMSLMGSGFKFINEKASGTCGCGTSFNDRTCSK